MGRFPRVIAVGEPHHVTQRGNARRPVFRNDSDRLVYLDLLRQNCRLQRVSVLGYCLMPNHVHLLAMPHRADALGLALRHTHGRYAAYLNTREAASGHVWQGRFYSCPLDGFHVWAALRYVERNPVRAAMAPSPEAYAWSSAAAHCGGADVHQLIDTAAWKEAWTPASWREFLCTESSLEREERQAEEIRKNTHTGRPLGTPDFVRRLERDLGRPLAPRTGGRPRNPAVKSAQQALSTLNSGTVPSVPGFR